MSGIPAGPQRRHHLHGQPNPATRCDYLVTLDGALGQRRSVRIAYVPDRLIVERSIFADYLRSLEALPWASPEQLGAALLDDIANTLVPRWLRVEITENTAELVHRVRLDERQPGWKGEVPPV